MDADGDGLSFTGQTWNVTSFTFAYYYYFDSSFPSERLWFIVPAHNFNGSYDEKAYRMHTYHTSSDVNLRYSNNGNIHTAISLPVSYPMPQWVHFAFTYDKGNGNMTIFRNGNLEKSAAVPSIWQAVGENGGFAIF